MRRALKKLGKLLAWIIGLVVALLFIALAEPKWYLNRKTLVWAIGKFGKSYQPTWKSLVFEVRNDNLLTKRILFKAEDFRVHEEHGALTAAFPIIDLDATIRLGLSPVVSVRRVERLVVRSDAITLDETKEPPPKKQPKNKAKSGARIQLIPPPLRRMTVGFLDLQIPSAVVKTATGTTTAEVAAYFSEKDDTPLTAGAYVVTAATGTRAASHYKADLTLASDLWRLGHLTYLDLKARLRGDAGLSADVAALVEPGKSGALRLSARALAEFAGKTAKAELAGDYSPRHAGATATIALEQPKGGVRRAALQDCRFDAPMHDGRAKTADLQCGIVVVPGPFGTPPGAKPKELAGSLTFHADFKRVRTMKDHFTARLKADIAPQAQWNDFFAHLELALAGRTGDLPESLTAEHKLDVGMTIKRFQDLVDYLKETQLAIPAPVNAFRGPVVLDARTAGDSRGENQRVVYRLSTDLASSHQAFKVLVDGRVDVQGLFLQDKKIVDRTQVDLEKVALQLPDISLKDAANTPSPVIDKSIATGQPARDRAVAAERKAFAQSARPAPERTNVDFDAHVFTSTPILILTNLIKNPVPIALDLHAVPDGLSGRITVEPFEVKIFRQKARVDHITLTPTPGSSDMKLNGKIVYKRQDATINILLVGSTDKPTITLISDPPMTQQEIMALLLYGESPNQLDSDQQASAGNAQAAFTSGALGLTSLFLFASTPIDSVGYDAATGTYQVRFKLPGGATLSVGSNLQESKTLALRKRVARNVELETQVSQTQQQSQKRNAVTTFLEWFKRF